ncbi:probable selenium-dependent hydroxylase accessory protein YqeC [Tindallia magadiensis]|uniref:Probable selenium-dependent hydroxylase accessory protein YqeC n=1 Tax=Tindallia magadiensis TaxID=69895 RepID=A0A1I3ES73_9FIRM|nr:selenium cofactor biosynthesis protein YqeC [Tindallia magadiensis]SFI01809.1 probable selenium-dependent hydroxylase accessory protein YqeC [Tindallia magadiensis]
MGFWEALLAATEWESKHGPRVISFVGAGGKTTSMFTLAKECREREEQILVTTTTAIYTPKKQPFDHLWIEAEERIGLEEEGPLSGITVWGDHVTKENKLKGIQLPTLETMIRDKSYDRILIEADGSKEKPLKAPDEKEPVIPEGTDLVIGVLGIRILDQKNTENHIHRSHLYRNITNSLEGESVTAKNVAQLVVHPKGLFKNTPKGARRLLLINQVDDKKRQQQAREIVRYVRSYQPAFFPLMATSFDTEIFQLKRSEVG